MKGVLKPLLALTVIAAVALPTRLVMQAGAIGAATPPSKYARECL